ncbi:hypothetical protein NY2A_b413R [Paramecium bursaria Chlorella virus NY2A]|uniref:Uncharacterized protein b413R n=1 Tax=Paramecium bursaria Chlorella virus NY2A TaxID=46021 RepID=A7IWT8_PBCVN|nr:hypothetical protein NY2A_b413R [Paramecium bursaria Chlorella virus NY2A]ABT14812.1 hypothetical protein NY2A_b413R [Paramecium bursaria Chlorella virus NY2A]
MISTSLDVVSTIDEKPEYNFLNTKRIWSGTTLLPARRIIILFSSVFFGTCLAGSSKSQSNRSCFTWLVSVGGTNPLFVARQNHLCRS